MGYPGVDMKIRITRKRLYDLLVLVGTAAAAAALLRWPQEAVGAARDGLALCFDVLVPSLFPYFVLSSLLVGTGVARELGSLAEPVMRRLFRVSGVSAPALILGFIGGYPVGAKTVIALHRNGELSRVETERLLAFCNNSGPAFILGVAGAGVFSSSRIGLLLYLAHVLASLIVGLLFRRWGGENAARERLRSHADTETRSFSVAFTGSVRSSFRSMIDLCGFVVFFTVLIRILLISGLIPAAADALGKLISPLGCDAAWAERLITGTIELTSGVWSLREAGTAASSVAMAAFMLGWAGVSVHCQTLSYISDSDLSAGTYVIGKLLHGVISAGIIGLISRLRLLDVPAAAYLAEEVRSLASLHFLTALTVSLCTAGGLFVSGSALVRYGKWRMAQRKRNGSPGA